MKPNKKTFQVLITTTFTDEVEVEATSEEEALGMVNKMIFDDEIETAMGEPNTELSILED